MEKVHALHLPTPVDPPLTSSMDPEPEIEPIEEQEEKEEHEQEQEKEEEEDVTTVIDEEDSSSLDSDRTVESDDSGPFKDLYGEPSRFTRSARLTTVVAAVHRAGGAFDRTKVIDWNMQSLATRGTRHFLLGF